MYWFLLKKVLPFTLTFIFGAVLSGLTGLFGPSHKKAEVFSLRYEFGREGGHGHCRMRSHNLVAESKPLLITFTPDAHWPRGVDMGKGLQPVQVRVTFGADGKVQKVQPWGDILCCKVDVPRIVVWEAVAAAARGIQFEPETINSVPVSVEKEVEIRFIAD
ncbi:MAG: hypothetical protein QOH49_3121 [Acidobacteriota bacterium]|jgi:hypothetical protein|nr:hypothetical protein [Acidobacteriota bacterium]